MYYDILFATRNNYIFENGFFKDIENKSKNFIKSDYDKLVIAAVENKC